MVSRLARTLLAISVIATLVGVRPADCAGWSLWPSFAADSKTVAKSKKTPAKKEPSLLEKASAGTKKFFSQAGETLGLKKPEPKKPLYAYPKTPPIQRQKPEQSKSWPASWFQKEEPKKPKTVVEWMSNERPEL